MKILLTGASGMVGCNLLLAAGAQEYEWLAPGRSELNLLDAVATNSYIVRHKPDLIIHAAGRVGGIHANLNAPVRFMLDNLDMGRNVLEAAALADVPRVLNLGSSCMYPRNRDGDLREEDLLTGELEPSNEGYALAKIVVASLGRYMKQENSGLSCKTLVPSNLYGPYDKFDPSHSHLIAAVIHKLHMAKIEGRESVEIWGAGEVRREFLFVGDLAKALLKAVSEFDSLPDLMNIGLGRDYTVNEYYQSAAEVVGYRGRFEHDQSKPAGMRRKLCNIDRARAWGWTPEVSLKQGLQSTYDYYLALLGE
ncbi:GDP-L-fucose synthase [Ectopseudomonas mendocina]|nr:GDP-L-fucose synthase [Pseudomonas mendocina]TRO20786.1 GDP-L-fucose synthase [Pseudomonas mendocina]TRO24991.1 GDP-L-fucose synthase [Pseudomonas mendocina]